jgi:hypothetical protein
MTSMNFGKRISMVLLFVATLAVAPLVALLTLCSDDGDLLCACKDWVRALGAGFGSIVRHNRFNYRQVFNRIQNRSRGERIPPDSFNNGQSCWSDVSR